MGPQDPKDVTRAITRGLSGLVGELWGHGTEMGIPYGKAYDVTQADREERFFAAHLADPSGLRWR